MPYAKVKYKHRPIGSPSTRGYASGSDEFSVSSNTPTESEVLAGLKKRHSDKDLIITEIKMR